jgi:hypothetical protein
MLLARIYEILPLVCPLWKRDGNHLFHHGSAYRAGDSQPYFGEPIKPPPITPARGPPVWEKLAQEPVLDTAQPEPEYDFNQTLNW